MPKPFFFNPFRRNFTGTGSRFSQSSVPHDRRVDWVSGRGEDEGKLLVPTGRLLITSDPPFYVYTFGPPSSGITITADPPSFQTNIGAASGSLTITSDPSDVIYALQGPSGSLTITSDPGDIVKAIQGPSGSLTIGSDPPSFQTNIGAASGSLTIGSDIAAFLYTLSGTSGSLTIGSDPAGVSSYITGTNGSLTIGSDPSSLIRTLLSTTGSLTILSDPPEIVGLDAPFDEIFIGDLKVIGGDVLVQSLSTPYPDNIPVQAEFLSILGGAVTVDSGQITVQVSDGAAGQMFTQGGAADIILINEELIQASQTTIGVSGFRATVQPDINPEDIDGLIGWWDAADKSTIRGNGDTEVSIESSPPVQYWYDKKSNIRMEQLTGANQPTWNSRQINGKPVVEFDGVDDNLTAATVPAHWDSLNDMTICYVANPTRTASGGSVSNVIFGYRTTGNGGGRYVRAGLTQDGVGYVNNAGTLQAPTDIDASGRPNWAIFASETSPTFGGSTFNDSTSTGFGSTGGSTPSSVNELYIGHWGNVLEFKGYIAEILVFNRQLGASERQRIAAYFDRKWFTAKAAPTDYIVGFNEVSEKWQETGRFTLADADGDSVRSIQNDGSLGGWIEWQAGGVPTLEFTDGASLMKQAAVTQATKGYFSLPDADELTPKSGQGFEVFVSFATSTTDTNIGPIGKWENSPTSEQEWYLTTQSSNASLSTTVGIKGSGGGAVSSWLDAIYDVRDGSPHVSHARIGIDDVIQMGLDGEFLGERTQVTDFPSNPSGTVQELIVFAYDDNYTTTGFTGSIRAVRIYDRELTDAERASVIEEMSR